MVFSQAVTHLGFSNNSIKMNEAVVTAATRTDLTVESILLDADLFVKYKSPDRAVQILQEALERSSRSVPLREKLREVCAGNGQLSEAARQCLTLASLYIAREDFQSAYDRLQEAKLLDPRVSIAPGLDAIRRAKHPELLQQNQQPVAKSTTIEVRRDDSVLGGNLSLITIFDALQVIENSKLTGALIVKNDAKTAKVLFNLGQIVDADANNTNGVAALRLALAFTAGMFEFTISANQHPIVIQAASNTNLLLDTLSAMDEDGKNSEEW